MESATGSISGLCCFGHSSLATDGWRQAKSERLFPRTACCWKAFPPPPQAGLWPTNVMKGNARLRSSLRLSINASPYHVQVQPFNAPDSPSPQSCGFSAGSSKTSAGSQGYRVCYALCLHDYFSDDPTHLSFSRNEVLEIIAQEDTGWWAAMRPGEDKVGWISRSVQLRIFPRDSHPSTKCFRRASRRLSRRKAPPRTRFFKVL